MRYFVAISRFVPFTHFLENGFRSKTVFLGHAMHYYMVFNACFTEFDLQICKDDAFVAKIENKRLTNIFMRTFALAERLPTSATLVRWLDH